MVQNGSKETLKNTGIVGSSRIVTIFITIIKTKFIVVMIGPAGIGLMELFVATMGLIQNIFSLGFGFSAVREISETLNNEGEKPVARIIKSVKRWTVFSSLSGTILTLYFSEDISMWSFGDSDHKYEICLLAITVFMNNLAAVHIAIVQGARRMADFAKVGIYTSLVAAIITIPIFYFMGIGGIVVALLVASFVSLIISYLYVRKVKIPSIKVSITESLFDGLGMLELGIYTLFTGFITQATLYYVRTSIGYELGLDEVGYFAAATTLTVGYMSIIFSAMSADYFPKLSAINDNNKALIQAVLEQTKLVLLLGVPLIIGMYTFSDHVIRVVYSNDFQAASSLLMFMLLSVFFKLITFPIAYVFLAKKKSSIYIFTQILWNVLFLIFVHISWKLNAGLEGIGISYVIACVFSVPVNCIILKKITSFVYDKETIILLTLASAGVIVYFMCSYFIQGRVIFSLKILLLFVITFLCLRKLNEIAGINVLKILKYRVK